tara:strand:+ start:4822 stop:6015 length:1194 start_codon:yes stop_codon:yes gene_type:complete
MKKIKFRTITSSLEISYESTEKEIKKQLKMILEQFEIFKNKSFDIKTLRINIIFSQNISITSLPSLINTLKYLESLFRSSSIDWFSMSLNSFQFENIDNISEIIKTIITKINTIFIHLIVDKTDQSLIYAYSKTIIDISRLSNNGFDNFRLGISNGKTRNTPFFPFSNFKKPLSYSVGLETLGSLIDKCYENSNNNFAENLIQYKNELIDILHELNNLLVNNSIINYEGIDASLAPIPRTNQSIGLLYELLSVNTLGNLGSLSITSRLTNLINESFKLSGAKKAGFNGVMFSPLEDEWLAKQSCEGILRIESLLLYSTVCGCGLDMVPVPGEIFSETIGSIICDVITLSEKLNKPLGVRILPIPGKFSNDKTTFNHEFLSDMKIFNIQGSSIPNIDF